VPRISELLAAEGSELQVSPRHGSSSSAEKSENGAGQEPAVQFPDASFAHLAAVSEEKFPDETGQSSHQDGNADEQSAFLLEKIEDEPRSRADIATLRVGNLSIPRNQFNAVVDPTGSGETSLLLPILSELMSVSGSHTLHGIVAYVGQEPFILSGTLKDNITLSSTNVDSTWRVAGAPNLLRFDPIRYKEVLHLTRLDADFAIFPSGAEAAIIGEGGGNLSGGQRVRVSPARALYSDADILLLDDPLAAVDTQVREMLFYKLMSDDRTVMLRKC
jgi:ABC-type multidrug transport system fused ATPase/permease subunit